MGSCGDGGEGGSGASNEGEFSHALALTQQVRGLAVRADIACRVVFETEFGSASNWEQRLTQIERVRSNAARGAR